MSSAASSEDLESRASAAVAAGDAAAARSIVDSITAEGTKPSVSRAALRALAAALRALPVTAASNALIEDVCAHAVERLRPRVAAGLDADGDFVLRRLLAQVHAAEDDHLRAASVLAQARIEAACETSEARADAFVRVARAYLAADDDVNADRFVKRAGDHVFRDGVPWETQVMYRSCVAQVLDARRRFLEAAQRYIELSLLPPAQMDEAELLQMLEKAVKCVVLAPAGPQRQRVMGTLSRDERLVALNPKTVSMLERMYNERFVSPEDAATFEAGLEVHQRAQMADGSTVFRRAVLEHNMAAAQRVYSAIALLELARRLGIDALRTEKMAAKMIVERRLAASIDQVDGMLIFAGAPAVDGGAGDALRGEDTVDALRAWDAKIKDVCTSINALADTVAKAFPAVVPVELRKKEQR